jgi:hypothetical protein
MKESETLLKQCIYCKKEGEEHFKGVEHVIPQSFGKFGAKTPTLKCVCDECNAYFSKHLDQLLARDTFEGITRHKNGILSREKRPQKDMRFTLGEGDETGDYGGILTEGIDGTTGKLGGPVPQAHFLNTNTKKYEIIPLKSLPSLEWKSLGYSDKGMKVFAPSKEKYDEVVLELNKLGITYKEKEWFESPPFVAKGENAHITLPVTVEGIIDKPRKRALVKILFNFAAYYLGNEEILKNIWDKARDFVRNDAETLRGRMTQEPFWTGEETKQMRFASDSYNLRIENSVIKGRQCVVGIIQLYNIFTYDFILAEGYSLSEGKEIACRFTPGEEPYLGVKMTKPTLP